jgi:hypothetical protein
MRLSRSQKVLIVYVHVSVGYLVSNNLLHAVIGMQLLNIFNSTERRQRVSDRGMLEPEPDKGSRTLN